MLISPYVVSTVIKFQSIMGRSKQGRLVSNLLLEQNSSDRLVQEILFSDCRVVLKQDRQASVGEARCRSPYYLGSYYRKYLIQVGIFKSWKPNFSLGAGRSWISQVNFIPYTTGIHVYWTCNFWVVQSGLSLESWKEEALWELHLKQNYLEL